VAILDDRNLFLFAFLAISDQNTTFIFFYKIAAGWHFGCPKFIFTHISDQNTNSFLFSKWPLVAILDVRNLFFVTFLVISEQNTTFILVKMANRGLLDVRNSFLVTFLAISDQITTVIFFQNSHR
jgi:hypothetical protein